MKKWKRGLKRIAAFTLAVILAGTTVDLSTFDVSAAEGMQTPNYDTVSGNNVCESGTEKNSVEQPENETAECTCGTDDDSIHAANCAVYVAPENPECYCTEKCTEANVWCDVCSSDYNVCKGTDSATVYDVVDSGKCGENLTWEIILNEDNSTYTLNISGSGAMADYTYNSSDDSTNAPWYYLKDSITTAEIGEGVTSIGVMAFAFCKRLTSIKIPNSVTSIGDWAFYECENLKSITIPDKVTSIGQGAFWMCGKLTSITIPKGVTDISYSTFLMCSALESVVIPEGMQSIGEAAFYSCGRLTAITIPESVTSIGPGAFQSCGKLTTIKLHCSRKEEINSDNFYGLNTTQLETVTYTHTIKGGYIANGNEISYNCENECPEEEIGVATLSVSPDADLSYTGSEVKPELIMDYPENWVGEKIELTTANCSYSNNTNAGTATGTFTYDGVPVSVNFIIQKATPTFSDAEIPTISGTYGEPLS